MLVFVVDAADKRRFDAMREFWRFIAKKLRGFKKENIRVVILAHKCDVADSVSSEELRRISGSDLDGLNASFLDTSIFDYVSIVRFLNTIHQARERRIDGILEECA